MTGYAQTNIQLYNQISALRYGSDDLTQIRSAYDLAMQLFTGSFRGSGRPFLAHLIGTASVLVQLRAPITVVTAGLLHSAYTHGEFGNYWRGLADEKRDRVRDAVGEEAEHLIVCYSKLPWTVESIETLAETAASAEGADRNVLLIRLANEVDDHQDLGLLYVAGVERRREFISTALYRCIEIAERLGYPLLAAELARVLDETMTAEVASVLRGPRDDSFLIAPASHMWRPAVVARWILARLQHSISGLKSPAPN